MNIIKAKPSEITKYAGMSTTPQDRHVDTALTNVSVAYMQDQMGFIADKVFPVVGVSKQSDYYYVYDKEAFLRNDVAERAPKTESAGVNLKLSTDNYFCKVYAVHADVDDQERANADPQVDPDIDAAELVMQQLLIARENQFNSSYFTTGVWGTDFDVNASSTYWDNDLSDPSNDIKDAKLKILKETGQMPNTFVVDIQTHEALKRHPLIIDRIKYTNGSTAPMSNSAIAAYLDVDRYIVSSAIQATNAEGATTTTDFIMGKKALLTYSAPSPSMRRISAGYNFAWSGFTGLNSLGIRTKKFRMENISADRVEGEMSYDMKVVTSDAGYYFYNTIS